MSDLSFKFICKIAAVTTAKTAGRNLSRFTLRCKKSVVFAFVLTLFALALPAGLRAIDVPRSAVEEGAVHARLVQGFVSIAKGDWVQGESLIRSTQDPFGVKLYNWMAYTQLEGDYSFAELSGFVMQNPDWPGVPDLRLKVEAVLDKEDVPRHAILKWFKVYPPRTTVGLDYYLDALIEEKKFIEAGLLLSDWWADTPLSRENQKLLFSKYKRYISHEAHVKRLDTLLFARQYTNAREVAKVLGRGYPALVEARIALAEGGMGVDRLIKLVPARLQNDPGLLYERVRWRRKKDMDVQALEMLGRVPESATLVNAEDWWHERHILARRFMEKGDFANAYRVTSAHKQKEGFAYAQAEWLTGFLALRFLDRPATGFQHFQNMYHKVSSPISRARGAYWAGRAAKELQQVELAKYWFSRAAQHQTVYYGQLASEELKVHGVLPQMAPPTLTHSDLERYNASELIRAARLLHVTGLYREAGSFIRAFVKDDADAKIYRFAAELAASFDQYHEAIRIAKQATQNGLFMTAQSYPVISNKLYDVRAEWALVHALIRQESQFDTRAISPAGALGLMQLMPATAKEVARGKGIDHKTQWLRSRPEHNIKLGSAYLKRMLRRYDNTYPLAVAAYNAGPRRVDKWLETYGDPRKRHSNVDMIDWIELMPIYETRNYVQRVMEGLYVYRLRLGTTNRYIRKAAYAGNH